MSLFAYIGEKHYVNDAVTQYACNNTPSVIIDCANSVDPHRYHGSISAEDMHEVYVLSIDLLYSFPDVLRTVSHHLNSYGAHALCVTSPDLLFDYQDADENSDLRRISWYLLVNLSKSYDVHVAVRKGGLHDPWARRFAIMGHTVSSQRRVTENILRELTGFLDALPADDRLRAQQLLEIPLQRLGAITSASSLHTWAFLLLCILLELEKGGLWMSSETKEILSSGLKHSHQTTLKK